MTEGQMNAVDKWKERQQLLLGWMGNAVVASQQESIYTDLLAVLQPGQQRVCVLT